MHQLEIFVTKSEYSRLCSMAMAIYMANENDPNGSTSSEIHPYNCRTEEKKLFLKNKFIGAMSFAGPGSSGKSN